MVPDRLRARFPYGGAFVASEDPMARLVARPPHIWQRWSIRSA